MAGDVGFVPEDSDPGEGDLDARWGFHGWWEEDAELGEFGGDCHTSNVYKNNGAKKLCMSSFISCL